VFFTGNGGIGTSGEHYEFNCVYHFKVFVKKVFNFYALHVLFKLKQYCELPLISLLSLIELEVKKVNICFFPLSTIQGWYYRFTGSLRNTSNVKVFG
jgi:hypothetical protein